MSRRDVRDHRCSGEQWQRSGHHRLKAEKAKTSARTGRNPQTGAAIQVPAGTRTKLTVGSKLKAAGKS
jgi:nucleoid DNA-binding protein